MSEGADEKNQEASPKRAKSKSPDKKVAFSPKVQSHLPEPVTHLILDTSEYTDQQKDEKPMTPQKKMSLLTGFEMSSESASPQPANYYQDSVTTPNRLEFGEMSPATDTSDALLSEDYEDLRTEELDEKLRPELQQQAADYRKRTSMQGDKAGPRGSL